MKQAYEVLKAGPSNTRRLQVDTSPYSASSSNCFPQLTLGGAICGGFAGSFAGALLGAAIGAVSSDISLGLDGALIGSVVAAAAGAAYGLALALREQRQAVSTDADKD